MSVLPEDAAPYPVPAKLSYSAAMPATSCALSSTLVGVPWNSKNSVGASS